jgi:glucose/arabinose dehydrogenase
LCCNSGKNRGLTEQGEARGRPVGVAVANGALLVADDVGNVIWRVR